MYNTKPKMYDVILIVLFLGISYMQLPPKIFSLVDLETHAHATLDKNAWEYFSMGASQQQTLIDNRDAFKRLVYI